MKNQNAADEKQINDKRSKEKNRQKQEVDDIKSVLSTVQGRRFIWSLLTHCRVFGSIWEPSAKIHYNSGRQDVGHYLIAKVTDADKDSYLLMMKENEDKE